VTAPESSQQAGFPKSEFGDLLKRLPAYAKLAWALAKDKRLSKVRRAAVLAAAAYVVSPIDLVPGLIPLVGQLDDLAIALAAIRLALAGLRPEFRAEKLAAAGLTEKDLADDVRTTGAIAKWLGRSSVRIARTAATTAVSGGRAAARALAGEVRRRRR
jgi:uncharacterized membrane protein YkvA (DUF1232 family)